MEKLASIFCHIPNGMLKDEAHRELWRQHDRLAQEANRMGRTIEHCFFHMGEFDLEKTGQGVPPLDAAGASGRFGPRVDRK